MAIGWSLKKFDDLTPLELYKIIQLRNEVFVVEQNCVYQDADNKDLSSYHFMGWNNDKLVAYTRLFLRDYLIQNRQLAGLLLLLQQEAVALAGN